MQKDNDALQNFELDALLAADTQPIARREHLNRVWEDLDRGLSRHRSRRWGRRAALATTVGLFAAVFLAVWLGTGPQAWAQLAEKLESKPWIKLGEDSWISLSKRVSAYGDGVNESLYEDHRNGIRTEYDPNANAVYVMDLFEANTTIFELFALALSGESPPADTDEVSVVKRVVQKADKRTAEYEAEIRTPNGEPIDRTVVVFSIPEGNTLPTHVTFRSWHSSKPDKQHERNFKVTYPSDGPGDIFALNVPKNAKIVVRTVEKPVRHIAEKVWKGRREFDSYHGVMVESDLNEPWWKSMEVKRVWRSGLKWRIETCKIDHNLLQKTWEKEQPGDDVDRTDWWITTAAKLGSFPESVSDGFESWVFEIDLDKMDENGNQVCKVTGIEKGHLGLFQGGPCPELGETAMPELAGRQLSSIGGRNLVSVLERNTAGGPVRTKLLKILRVAGDDAGTLQKYWISPELGHLNMQYDFIQPEGAVDRYKIVTTNISPGRFFYPTEIHREVGKDQSSLEVQEVYRYYLDFDAEIPDGLFDPKFETSASEP